jgi:hypothetical protein
MSQGLYQNPHSAFKQNPEYMHNGGQHVAYVNVQATISVQTSPGVFWLLMMHSLTLLQC